MFKSLKCVSQSVLVVVLRHGEITFLGPLCDLEGIDGGEMTPPQPLFPLLLQLEIPLRVSQNQKEKYQWNNLEKLMQVEDD